MPIHIHSLDRGRCLNIVLIGTLDREDYRPLVAEFTRLAEIHGKLRVLLVMTRFHGWSVSGLWEEIKFDLKHLDKLERLAVVGEARWQHAIASFVKPLTPAEVHYFDGAQINEAQAWLAGSDTHAYKAA